MKSTTIALLAALSAQSPPPAALEAEGKLVPSITVTGTGEVGVRSEVAEVTLGVTTEDESARDALEENSRRMEKVLGVLDERGIAAKDRRTVGLDIAPRYRDGKFDGRRITGYRVTNLVRVKVRDLDSLGEVLDEVVREGANTIHGIRFGVSDAVSREEEARRRAIRDARRKAEVYAEAAGVEVGAPLVITEQGESGPRFEALAVRAAGRGVPIERGEEIVRASVTVTFRIREAERRKPSEEEAREERREETSGGTR